MLAMGILITGPLFILLLLLAIAVVWGGSIVMLAGLAWWANRRESARLEIPSSRDSDRPSPR
jgi:hypothetical protein